jgi:hypothetical protein
MEINSNGYLIISHYTCIPFFTVTCLDPFIVHFETQIFFYVSSALDKQVELNSIEFREIPTDVQFLLALKFRGTQPLCNPWSSCI